jgi:NAD(P)-dependent dehydrogenase (short-subunit alcohol dehydrogenase family)
MTSTVLITGCSTGIGKATALYFAQQGWHVIATMRKPDPTHECFTLPNVQVYPLDVTDPDSINRTLPEVIERFKRIQVLVNNAGFAVDGIFEAMTDEVIEKQFNTNVFGVMRMTRAILPHFREHGGGILIQVTSMGGRITFPLYSIYHGSKWAVEGFSESLHYELDPVNIQIKLIEPGVIKTEFYGRSREFVMRDDLDSYKPFLHHVDKISQGFGSRGVSPEAVAKVIFRAATDHKRQFRYIVGYPAPLLLGLRKWLPDQLFFAILKHIVYKL